MKEEINRVLYTRLLGGRLRGRKEVNVLDVGCADAKNFYYLQNNCAGLKYLGIDMNEKSLGSAAGNKIPVAKADLEHGFLPVKTKFDIIMLTEVIEHLRYPAKIIERLTDALKNDGSMLISLPNEYNLLSRVRVLLNAGIDDNALLDTDKHVHFPTIAQSRKFIGRYFDIQKTIYWSSSGGRLQAVLKFLPDSFYTFMAGMIPGLFARGMIFLCAKRVDGRSQ